MDNGTICNISFYVDDLLIAGSSQVLFNSVQSQFKDLEVVNIF